jgi:hypothetical protein
MPYQLTPAPNSNVTLTPYKGPDAQSIIAHTQRPSRSDRTNSISSQDPVMALANGNVSPAVSMMILAATAAGPPGNFNAYQGPINGTNGVGYALLQQQQPVNGDGLLGHRGSNGNLRASVSQGSILDNFAYGLNGGVSSMSGPIVGTLSASSSWSDTSSTFSNHRAGIRNPSLSLHPFGISMSRSALEDIAEASSREEHPHSQAVSRANSTAPLTPENAANIIITASTPVMDMEFITKQHHANDGSNNSGRSSPQGKTRSDTERPGGPWLSREPSPTPSLPTLHKQTSLNDLVEGVNGLSIQRHAEGTPSDSYQDREGIHTPPESATHPTKTATPPRIGNPGKRMLGHALGIRHPSLPPRVIAGTTSVTN